MLFLSFILLLTEKTERKPSLRPMRDHNGITTTKRQASLIVGPSSSWLLDSYYASTLYSRDGNPMLISLVTIDIGNSLSLALISWDTFLPSSFVLYFFLCKRVGVRLMNDF